MVYSSFLRPARGHVPAVIFLGICSATACSSEDASPPPPTTASGGITGTGGDGAGGSTGGTVEASGGQGGSAMDPVERTSLPDLLSEAGLYEADMETLAPGVRPFRPQFQLWTDDAAKRRWIWLPEGEQIDTTDMEYWQYPIGTRLYKEFVRDGVRVETRVIEKRPNGGWWMLAYQWREDQTDADAVPEGVNDASGTPHDIPSEEQCQTCHLRMPDKALGFSAIQLAHTTEPDDPTEWTLTRLAAEGRLTTTPPTIQLPGDETDRQVLGYLHGNCGHCHHPRSSVNSRVDLRLWLRTDALDSVEGTPTYETTVGVGLDLPEDGPPGPTVRIVPGDPAASALFVRMDSRGPEYQMPPLGTEDVDPTARALLETWIQSLTP